MSLGDAVADKLKHRLADIRAARSVEDLPVGRPHIWRDDGKHIAVELCDGQSLVFVANHTNNPITKAGILDWPKVSRIKIVRIGSEND